MFLLPIKYKRERQELKFQAENSNEEAIKILQQLEKEEQRLESIITEAEAEAETEIIEEEKIAKEASQQQQQKTTLGLGGERLAPSLYCFNNNNKKWCFKKKEVLPAARG